MDNFRLHQKVLTVGIFPGNCLLLGILLIVLSAASSAASTEKAVRFSGTTLSGEPVSFDPDSINRPVLIVFWASWCRECRYEFHALKALETETRGRLEILGINVDRDVGKAVSMARKAALPYPSVSDPDALISGHYKVRATPTIVLIDSGGRIRHTGHRLDATFRVALDGMLN